MTSTHSNPTRLDGQVAIVTGAAQGIGRGIAHVLAEAGAKIVIGDIQDASPTVQEIRSNGGQSISVSTDTSSPEDAQSLVDAALEEYGRLDILVNNAGIDAPPGNAWDLPDAEWERTIAVNLSGVFYCSKAALKPMLATAKGCIISISSQEAQQGHKGGSPAYNASKAGVLGITAAFAAQVSEKGIRVNAVMPGLVESRNFGWTSDDREARAKEYPLGIGTPRDIGEVVRYLASPAAKWVSGEGLLINGGSQMARLR